jgi:uncharacterized protein HemX
MGALAALLALLGIGGAGIYMGKRLEESTEKEMAFKNQSECFALAKEGKIDPKVCASIGKDTSTLSSIAEVAEETGKVILAATAAYVITRFLKRQQ